MLDLPCSTLIFNKSEKKNQAKENFSSAIFTISK